MSAAQKLRKDPPTHRPVVFSGDRTRLDPKSIDPKRKYEFADPNSQRMGVRQRESLGWVLEVCRKDGPRLLIGNTVKEGEVIEFMGMHLMSCPIERWEQARKEGWYGDGGQDLADAFDRRLADKRRGGAIDRENLPRVEGVRVVRADADQE